MKPIVKLAQTNIKAPHIHRLESSKKTLGRIILLTIFTIFIVTMANKILCPLKVVVPNTTMLFMNKSAIVFHANIAVLVEFRTTDQIVTVVHNVNYHIPSTWPIQIFHGKDNQDFIKNSTLAPLITSGKVFLTLMNEVYARDRTNDLLTNRSFWQQVHGEKILFFQIDSIMCSNSPHKITDYLQYDYVGAPWNPSWFPANMLDFVGNGGFSLRSRSKMLNLIALLPYDRKLPEDVWYGLNLRRVNGLIALFNVAKTFAVESVYYERPLGAHGSILQCSFRAKLFETCPEAMMIMKNKCN